MNLWKKSIFSSLIVFFATAWLCFGAASDYKVTNDGTGHFYGLNSKSPTGTLWQLDIISKGPSIDVRAFGAVGDGTTNDATAIQNAINAAKDSVEVPTSGFTQTATVIVPQKTFAINSPLLLYSGVNLIGLGPSSQIIQGSSFSGNGLIKLTGSAYYATGEISNLQLKTTTAGVAVIRQNAASVGNSKISNIILNATEGIVLDSYTQDMVIKKIYSYGSINHIVYLKGNFNKIEDINSEGAGVGLGTDGYVYIEDHSGNLSTNNELKRILIENVSNGDKPNIQLDTCKNTVIEDSWSEVTNPNHLITMADCENTWIKFPVMGLTSTQKINIATSKNTVIENLEIDALDLGLESFLTMDAVSDVHIRNVYSRTGKNIRIIDNPLITIDKLYNRQIYTDANAGYLPVNLQRDIRGQNLLINPSFESGIYGWSTDGGGLISFTFEQSQVGQGNHVKVLVTANGEFHIYQTNTITVPASWVGRTLTLSFLARVITTSGPNTVLTPYISGAGISTGPYYNTLYANKGWGIISQSFTIQEAGNLYIGVTINFTDNATDIVYLDDFCLSFGMEALLGNGKFGDISLGAGAGNTVSYGSAAPTTGTWKQGDIVWNNAPSVGQPMGWMCTVAGPPGTWTAMPNL
jgi:hypothetical protein